MGRGPYVSNHEEASQIGGGLEGEEQRRRGMARRVREGKREGRNGAWRRRENGDGKFIERVYMQERGWCIRVGSRLFTSIYERNGLYSPYHTHSRDRFATLQLILTSHVISTRSAQVSNFLFQIFTA